MPLTGRFDPALDVGLCIDNADQKRLERPSRACVIRTNSNRQRILGKRLDPHDQRLNRLKLMDCERHLPTLRIVLPSTYGDDSI